MSDTNITMFERLKEEIKKVKNEGNINYKCQFYELYGKVLMARELEAITKDQFMELNHDVVAEGINNPKYFNR